MSELDCAGRGIVSQGTTSVRGCAERKRGAGRALLLTPERRRQPRATLKRHRGDSIERIPPDLRSAGLHAKPLASHGPRTSRRWCTSTRGGLNQCSVELLVCRE